MSVLGTLVDGRYRLDARIAAGGMSVVYRAFDLTLEREVAVKLMNRELAEDSDQLERFRREARAVASLSHPHVVQVIDAGEDDHHPYIVLEYVEGETLKARIRRLGRLPVGEAVAYAVEIARALGAAHARGIVHRDVKPQNVLIDAEGSAKVTDFGIARTLDEEGLTAEGRVLGTTDYVSPEQALGHAVTGQSDLYSLGIVLFEMLTGEVPFKGENQVAVAMKHVREAVPDVRALRPEVSTALAVVVDRATAKDLDVRYLDDDELVADLEDALALETARSGSATGEQTRVLETLPRRVRARVSWRILHPAWLGLAALVAVAATALALLLAADRTTRGTGARADVRPPPGLTEVSLGQRRATDYDPYGDDREEHPEEAALVLDGDPSTGWSTETYSAPLEQIKPGVGLVLDAKPGVAARQLRLRTSTPGIGFEVYGAADALPDSVPDAGWTRVATVADSGRSESVDLDTAGRRMRFYLVWITRVPEDAGGSAKLTELSLFA